MEPCAWRRDRFRVRYRELLREEVGRTTADLQPSMPRSPNCWRRLLGTDRFCFIVTPVKFCFFQG